jgi:hypothetical protein
MDQEEAAIKAFIVPNRQERYLGFLSSPKRRARFTSELAHFKALNPKYCLSIPPDQRNPTSLLKLLNSMGAGPNCWIISEWKKLDAREMDLETALREIIGMGMGTIISCIPGRLAYFEDENVRYILRR